MAAAEPERDNYGYYGYGYDEFGGGYVGSGIYDGGYPTQQKCK